MGNPSDNITPNTVILIILLNELNDISELEVNQTLSKFIIDRILVRKSFSKLNYQSQKVWLTFKEFQEDLKKEVKNPLLPRLVSEKVLSKPNK